MAFDPDLEETPMNAAGKGTPLLTAVFTIDVFHGSNLTGSR
jgi:hypothetical protein